MSNFSGHEIPLITNEQVKLKMDDKTELILILQNDGRVRIMSSYCRLGIIPVSENHILLAKRGIMAPDRIKDRIKKG